MKSSGLSRATKIKRDSCGSVQVCPTRHSFPAEPRQTTQNDGLSHSAFFSSRAKTDHAKRWSVQVCPTRHSFPAEPRQTTQNDGLSHSAFFSSRAKTDHAKRWSV